MGKERKRHVIAIGESSFSHTNRFYFPFERKKKSVLIWPK